MGIYLDKPNTKKSTEVGDSSMCKWGAMSMQGKEFKKVGA